MDNNTNDPANRVTRSLRKRMPSVDSDNSSRHGTPVASKLTSISETTASPSKPTRMTRRNSTSGVATPVKTPAKRGASSSAIPENTEITPARRSTRRCSISLYENEETPQTTLKIPTFGVLDEEIESSVQTTPTVTRSQSKSPQQIKTAKSLPSPIKSSDENKSKELEKQSIKIDVQKRRKPGPKCKTRGRDELKDDSDIEVSVFENELEHTKINSNITTITLTDDDLDHTIPTKIEEDKISQENVKSILENDVEHHNVTDGVEQDSLNNEFTSERNIVPKNTAETGVKILEETTDIKCGQKNIPEPKATQIETDDKQNQHMSANDNQEMIVTSMEDSTDIKAEVQSLQENELNLTTAEVVEFNKDTNDINVPNENDLPIRQDKENTPSADKDDILTVNILPPLCVQDKGDSNLNDCKESSKKVDFLSSPSNDLTIKNVYPRTPASTKVSNSFKKIISPRDDDSFHAENNTLVNKSDNRQDATPESGEDNDNNALYNKEVEDKLLPTHIESKTTPTRIFKPSNSLEKVQNSTPINVESYKHEELYLEEEKIDGIGTALNELEECPAEEPLKDESHTNEILVIADQNEELKWTNPSVKGTTVEGSKLDTVVTLNLANTNDFCGNLNSIVENKNKSVIFSSKYDGDKEEVERDDEEVEGELESEENAYKHDFHDDEAMEVDDYESGDSMDSEERKEMEENNIPVDAESIGSHTTEEECTEEEDSEHLDSFIVSDNEILECSDSYNENEQIDVDLNKPKRNKKKIYKRLQTLADSSSSEEEEEVEGGIQDKLKLESSSSDNDDVEKNDTANKNMESDSIFQPDEVADEEANQSKETKLDPKSGDLNTVKINLLSKSTENIILDASKLSETALRLQCSSKSESEEENEVEQENANTSRREILRKLNQSDRFNKSVRDLNPEIDTSLVESSENQLEDVPESKYDRKVKSFNEGQITSPEENAKNVHNSRKLQSESQLGEVSVTSESDADKENVLKSSVLAHHRKSDNGKSKIRSKGKQDWQQSFTIDVTVKDGDLETAVTDVKLLGNTRSSISPSSDDCQSGEPEGEDLRYLENIMHMPLPLRNPLIRTRRQSLALPTNPDMEICSSSHRGGIGKKPKRKSLGVLSSSEFNPSQSFIDSIELHKSELNRQVAKRKRLSKSFCGVTETIDNSIVDIDVRHLHKRSKLMDENSLAESHHDSIENISPSKLSSKVSSTPHNNDSNNNQRILNRCNEILEAANRAKLEAKINNKKSKGKTSKKLRKKSSLTLLNEANPVDNDDVLRRVSKEIKRKNKTKAALSQAIKAADVILGKKKQTQFSNEEGDDLESKRLPEDVLEAFEQSASIKKKFKKEIQKNLKKKQNIHTTSTSAGNFMEMPQTPKKKAKKPIYIQLPTGKVSVEPVTPKKHTVQAINGAEFRESPITPYAAGFKIRQIPFTENIGSPSSLSKNGKRKRHHDETPKRRTLKKSQWTQSGLFIEEEIPSNRRIARSEGKRLHEREVQNEHIHIRNFKENAMMRPEIKRNTKREILLLKERRQVQDHHHY